jgi:hypothetical protein
MSQEEIATLREDIAELRAILTERAAHSDRNGKFLHAIVVAVCCQLIFTVFYAGAKTALLDRLAADVRDIQIKIDAHR